MPFKFFYTRHLRGDLVIGVPCSQITRLRYSALLTFAALLVGNAAANPTAPREQEAGQEDVQRDSQNMTQAQRSTETRVFLGLGPIPDKAASARGAPLFAQNCAFCHGQAGRGAIGPSLITSDQVLTDERGEQLVPFLKKGTPEKGMPAFATMPDQELMDIAEFLHLQVEGVANRGAYKVLNILVGNVTKGKAYVESHCMSCHTAETFAHIASKFHSPEQLQRSWIWPVRAKSITANVKTSGLAISGRVEQISDFCITLMDNTGEKHTLERGPTVEVQMNDPLAAHQQLVITLGNDDMHNVTAYLETLK